jgi:hypothetical protein
MTLELEEAQKVKLWARVALWGTEKSGKTHSALMLATALAGEGGKVGVVSSEYGSSKLLAHRFPHTIADLTKADKFGNAPKNPFSPERYEEALNLFLKAGYQAIVIDSFSHAWAGQGGILDIVGKAGFQDGWSKGTPAYNRLIDVVLGAKCHIIVTLRAKDKYEMEEYVKRDGTTKGVAPKNVGEAPVMRKGLGYEMQLIIRMDSMIAHIQASGIEDYIHKGEEIEKPGPELAYRLLEALDGVEPPEPTAQELAVQKLLGDYQELFPSYCSRVADWSSKVLRAALALTDGEMVPVTFTDDDVNRLDLYVASKRKDIAEKQAKIGQAAQDKPTPEQAQEVA